MIPAARRFTAADLCATRSLSRNPQPLAHTRAPARSILQPPAVLAISRRIGGFFFAQNRPEFFLCRIFDPANFSRPGSPEAII